MESGERIPAGGGIQAGPIAPGLQSSPVGRAFVFDHPEPDLFVMANRHSLDPGPGLYLYEWTGRNEEGVPVFAPGQKIDISLADPASPGISDTSPGFTGSIFQMNDGSIHGWWLIGSGICRTLFDKDEFRFNLHDAGKLHMTGLPSEPEIPSTLAVSQINDSTLQIILAVNDGVKHRPDGYWRDPEYIMYNGAGIFLGNWPHEYLYISDTITPGVHSPVRFNQYSPTKKEVLHNYQNLTLVEYENGGPLHLLTGTRYGSLLYYPLSSGENAGIREYVTDESGIILRHKAVAPFPLSYLNAETKLFSDLIVGGECELIYYPFSGKFHKNGAPIYGKSLQLLQQNATLYTGSLPVVNTVDWDNDGRLDIVSGNSEGRVLLFINDGTNERPSFSKVQEVKAGGRPIHIQPGYNGSIQGPAESRWGYSCPTVTDWDGDGLFDILMHSAVARHEVYLNTGKPGKPEFDLPVPVYCEGLELHGTWRVQPGVKKMGEKMAYVILDDEDEFHIYWQIDAHNVDDGGKLRMEDGSPIRGNLLSAGGTGRLKLVLEDWDLDGKTDLLVGTPRHGSVPDPVNGLPQSRGLKGASVLFLKNIGTNNQPMFAFPQMIKFKGNEIYLGQHACSPEVWDYGQPDGPDLLVGEQDGRIRFYKRKDLSWGSPATGNQKTNATSSSGKKLPNIILLMADDLGYGDVACYGNPVVKTPHLDAMARAGIRFNRFYSAAPVCSPTRGSCLTGRHPNRYGIRWAGRHPLPESEITLAEALKSRGYATGHFGKWHLGGLSRTIIQGEFPDGPSPYSPPWENGFDECFSTESMVPTYNPCYHVGGSFGEKDYRQVQNVPVERGQRTGGSPWRDRYWTGPGRVVDEWLEGDDSKIMMDRALDFIGRKTGEGTPFLAVIWFHAPHTPVVAGNEHRELYPGLPVEKQHWFGAITAMDEQVGRLRDYLRSNGLAKHTLLWFCSDNGPSYIHDHNSAGPLRGKKSELYEGGIRVPAMLEWPEKFQHPMTVETPASTSDFYPTLLAVTSIEMKNQPPLDGENILPVLEGKTRRREPIGFLSPLPSPLRKQETVEEEQVALIDSRYKIISMDNGASFQLYDLVADEGETTDIAPLQPVVFNDMKNKLTMWISSFSDTAGSVFPQSMEIIQKQIPVLTLKEGNPVLTIKVNAGRSGAEVREILLDLTGTSDPGDLENVRIYYQGENMQDGIQFGETLSSSASLCFRGRTFLSSGTGNFNVVVQLRNDADILNKLVIRVTHLKTDTEDLLPNPGYEPLALRFGTALCQHMEDGVHTYRIPGMVRTNTGTLLAIFDRRVEAKRDPQGWCNIGMKRSTDGGKTWEPARIILDRGYWGGWHPRYNGVTDACILVNEENNEIFVGALWMHGHWVNGVWEGEPSDPAAELGRKKGSRPGMSEKETCQFLLTKSTDDGRTWSEPMNMTSIKNPEWRLYALSPTNGITLDDGTLVFPSKVPGNVALTYSKDGGRTWKVSNLGPRTAGVENAIVQLEDGSIMLNARHAPGASCRTVYTTPDLGETWVEHPTSGKVLAGPGCHGSLYKHVYYQDGEKKNILFFSNPNSMDKRERMTIRASFDEGMTWPEKYWILLDEERSAYSSLTSVDDQTIGILYEGSQAHMTFQKIPISEFIGNKGR